MAQIDSILEQARQGATLTVPASWGQGRTVFGGLSAAIMNQAMTSEVPDDRMMRVQNTQFISPLYADEPFKVNVIHMRDGKNVTQIQAQLIQRDQIAVQSMAAFGVDRDSGIAVPAPCIDAQPPKRGNWIPQIPKVVPKFFRYIDIRIEDGGYPFTGRKTAAYRGWMRFKDAPEQITDAHLITLIDAWPPTVSQQLRRPAPFSTLSWNVEFIHPHPRITGQSWLAYHCDTRQALNGYAHTFAKIYSESGQMIAVSRQVVTVFDQ